MRTQPAGLSTTPTAPDPLFRMLVHEVAPRQLELLDELSGQFTAEDEEWLVPLRHFWEETFNGALDLRFPGASRPTRPTLRALDQRHTQGPGAAAPRTNGHHRAAPSAEQEPRWTRGSRGPSGGRGSSGSSETRGFSGVRRPAGEREYVEPREYAEPQETLDPRESFEPREPSVPSQGADPWDNGRWGEGNRDDRNRDDRSRDDRDDRNRDERSRDDRDTGHTDDTDHRDRRDHRNRDDGGWGDGDEDDNGWGDGDWSDATKRDGGQGGTRS
jgi:hypothetical protein